MVTQDALAQLYQKLLNTSWNSPAYSKIKAEYEKAQMEYYGFIPCAIGPVKTPEEAA